MLETIGNKEDILFTLKGATDAECIVTAAF